jgi:hypothetical protein
MMAKLRGIKHEESRMPAKGPGQYAPWSDDPDPPPKEMSDKELKAAVEAVKKRMSPGQKHD